MSITEELREWINGNTVIHVTELRAIADRIDRETLEPAIARAKLVAERARLRREAGLGQGA